MNVGTVEIASRAPVELGARFNLLTHAVFFGSDLITDGVFQQPFLTCDERAEFYGGAVATIRG